jgi:hypothetical protein
LTRIGFASVVVVAAFVAADADAAADPNAADAAAAVGHGPGGFLGDGLAISRARSFGPAQTTR